MKKGAVTGETSEIKDLLYFVKPESFLRSTSHVYLPFAWAFVKSSSGSVALNLLILVLWAPWSMQWNFTFSQGKRIVTMVTSLTILQQRKKSSLGLTSQVFTSWIGVVIQQCFQFLVKVDYLFTVKAQQNWVAGNFLPKHKSYEKKVEFVLPFCATHLSCILCSHPPDPSRTPDSRPPPSPSHRWGLESKCFRSTLSGCF